MLAHLFLLSLSFFTLSIMSSWYGNTKKDAAEIDFDDDFIYQELDKPIDRRSVPFIHMLNDEALSSFKLWSEKTDKTEY